MFTDDDICEFPDPNSPERLNINIGFGDNNSTGCDLKDPFRSFRPDGFYPEQEKFSWCEDDGADFGKEFKTETDDSESYSIDVASKECLERPLRYDSTIRVKSNSVNDGELTRSSSAENVQQCSDDGGGNNPMHYLKYMTIDGKTVKLWECGLCGREFQHQYTLLRHMPTHTDERNYHCEQCGKAFRQLSTLTQHRAIHSEARPFSCDLCPKTFNRVSTLISHKKTHSKDKPYKCHLCPKSFHQKGNFRNHLFTHTNARPYRCNICGKGFNQQSNLVCHKNKSHSIQSSDGSEIRSIKCHSTNDLNDYSSSALMRQTQSQPDTSVNPLTWYLLPNQNLKKLENLESMLMEVTLNPLQDAMMRVPTVSSPFAVLKPDCETPRAVRNMKEVTSNTWHLPTVVSGKLSSTNNVHMRVPNNTPKAGYNERIHHGSVLESFQSDLTQYNNMDLFDHMPDGIPTSASRLTPVDTMEVTRQITSDRTNFETWIPLSDSD